MCLYYFSMYTFLAVAIQDEMSHTKKSTYFLKNIAPAYQTGVNKTQRVNAMDFYRP